MIIRRISIYLALTTALLYSCSNTDPAKLIIGKWKFVKFYAGPNLDKEIEKTLEESNSKNKGLSIRFSPSGECESDQPGGPRENNLIADYKVLPGSHLVIEKDTFLIDSVDDTYLLLSRPGDETRVQFRRINYTGTEPGRR